MLGRLATRLKAILQRPYPLWAGPAREAGFVVAATVLASVFIFLLQPFGLGRLPPAARLLLLIQIAFGVVAVSLLMRVALPFCVERRIGERSWTLAHRVALDTLEILALAAAILLIVAGNGHVELHSGRLPVFVLFTAVCASIPLSIKALLLERRMRLAFQRAASSLPPVADAAPPSGPDEDADVTIVAQDGTLTVRRSGLRCVRAEENYVDVAYMHDGVLRRRLLRATLKEVEAQLAGHGVVRSHRSHLVSLAAVVAVNGNAQGCRLVVRDVAEELPVSRSRTKNILGLCASSRRPSLA